MAASRTTGLPSSLASSGSGLEEVHLVLQAVTTAIASVVASEQTFVVAKSSADIFAAVARD